MQTASFVTASAQVTRITELVKGDVFKRLEEGYGGTDEIVFGVVMDVLHNGEDAAISAMEFKPSYSDLTVSLKTYAGKRDLKIFPATQDELKIYLEDAEKQCDRQVEAKRKELFNAEATAKRVKELVSGEITKRLTTPQYTDQRTGVIEASAGETLAGPEGVF